MHRLRVTKAFLSLFKTKYPNNVLPDQLSVRFQALTFGNLFFRRFTPSHYLPSPLTLHDQRKRNESRANTWLETHQGQIRSSTPHGLSEKEISLPLQIRRDMLAHMGFFSDSDVPDVDSTVSLLDTLPEFMSLFYMLAPEDKARLAEVAVVLMLQAAIEQILVHGRRALEVVNEAFAWNWSENSEAEPEGSEHADWDTLKYSMKTSISQASSDVSSVHGFNRLLHEYPLFTFEGSTLEALESLANTLAAPVLVQLERGKLEGLTEDETAEFEELVGIL